MTVIDLKNQLFLFLAVFENYLSETFAYAYATQG